jgi:hypothetical protein
MAFHFVFGAKLTLIKLTFKPGFGLNDNGPNSENKEAVVAWETVMHDIYFLGGGGGLSETHWGRIVGTLNQILIKTGEWISDMDFVGMTQSNCY